MQAELVAAAPNNPVYVQLGYGWAMLTPMTIKALNITTAADGSVSGGQNTIIALFDKLPKPTFDQQVDGTKKFFKELNRLGITGVYDPGGNNLLPEAR
jgi:predicted amidohydrolase YtcJ